MSEDVVSCFPNNNQVCNSIMLNGYHNYSESVQKLVTYQDT